jgi:hypothetical protein
MPGDCTGFFSSKKTYCPYCSAGRRKSRLALLLVTLSVALSQYRNCTRVSSHAAVYSVNLEEHHNLFMVGNMFVIRIASRDRHCERLATVDGQDFATEDTRPTLVRPRFYRDCLQLHDPASRTGFPQLFEGGFCRRTKSSTLQLLHIHHFVL